jgi:glyoxalase family protein
MSLAGLHHVTAITGDAPANLRFYTETLGLRLVKKTVNFDAPDVYHLYYGDYSGTPGSLLTFFEFPHAARGRAGDGMIHRVVWRVASDDALAFWQERVGSTVFADPEGLEHEIVVAPDEPQLTAPADGIPAEFAIGGLHAVRAFARHPERSAPLVEALGLEPHWYLQDPPPDELGIPGAGTVHHVAWSAADDAELTEYRQKAQQAGAHATQIIDRQYFHSVYFREPGGVLFELASRDIGFTVDEPLETLGEALMLPPQHEHLRAQLEQLLTPLT